MAARNPWVLPAAILGVLGVLAVAVLGEAAISARSGPAQPATSILQVPARYATIQAAIDAAAPGDIIQVASGTYNESLLLSKPVVLTAASFDQVNAANNNTVLDGGNGQATIVIPSGLSPMPAIQGFVIRNSRDGIEAHSRFLAQDNYFYGSQISVEYFTGAGGINRENVYFNSADDAVHIDDMAVPLLIQNNRFMYAGNDAIEVDLPGSSAPPTPVELDIWDNLLIGSSQDGIKFVDYATNPRDMNRHIVIAGNLIASNRRAGIGFMHSGNTNEDYSGVDAAEAVRVYNDTFYANDYGISGGDNVVAFNNIIAGSTSRAVWRVQGGRGANSVVAHTLFFGNHVDSDQTLIGPGDLFGQDPLFVAAPGPGPDGSWGTVDDDFSGLVLQPGSPAVDRGVAQYRAASGEAIPPASLIGYSGAAPDLGWRELGSPIFMTSTPQATAVPAVGLVTPPTAVATTTRSAINTQAPELPAITDTPGAASTSAVTATPLVIIMSISPASVRTNDVVTVTIKGAGFVDGAVVGFEGLHESRPQVTGVKVVDSSTIVAQVDAADDAHDTDVWDVRVTNPDGTTARLVSAFTVVP